MNQCTKPIQKLVNRLRLETTIAIAKLERREHSHIAVEISENSSFW
jgi:hypothetical protein